MEFEKLSLLVKELNLITKKARICVKLAYVLCIDFQGYFLLFLLGPLCTFMGSVFLFGLGFDLTI
jgi:hypothetical protein